jgi:hypothetical protein
MRYSVAGRAGSQPVHSSQQPVHIGSRVIEAEAEAQPPPAPVRDNIGRGEAGLPGLRLLQVEDEEIAPSALSHRDRQTRRIQRMPRKPGDEARLQGMAVGVDGRGIEAKPLQPTQGGVEPVEAGGIEGRAHEPPPIGGIGDAGGGLGQGAEAGEPAGGARPGQPAGRAVQEAGPFTRHGVFIAAGQVEGAVGQGREIDRLRQEGVIAVNDQHCLTGRPGQLGETLLRVAGGEEDLADPNQVETPARGLC